MGVAPITKSFRCVARRCVGRLPINSRLNFQARRGRRRKRKVWCNAFMVVVSATSNICESTVYMHALRQAHTFWEGSASFATGPQDQASGIHIHPRSYCIKKRYQVASVLRNQVASVPYAWESLTRSQADSVNV